MFVVRYAVLAALVVWLGALQGTLAGVRFAGARPIALACGGAIVVGLFTMKFLGPPPRAFLARTGIVVLMLALTIADGWWIASATPAIVNTALGFVLLSWYAHE